MQDAQGTTKKQVEQLNLELSTLLEEGRQAIRVSMAPAAESTTGC